MKNRAVVLLSGGLDSATALYVAKSKGYDCYSLIFDYGQRHLKELDFAKRVALSAASHYKIIKISLPWRGSSLLDKSLKVRGQRAKGIPNTYVPGRNIIFLSFALSYAEAIGAKSLFIGAHAQDYSGYPDCRPEFLASFRQMAKRGTKAGVGGSPIKIEAPLINKKKSEIIKIGMKLKVPYELTWSCYRGGSLPCGTCDSCRYRAKGFKEAGLPDPLFKK